MTFTVEPGAVRGFAGTVNRLTDDADTAAGCSRDRLGIAYDKGRMFFAVVETATTVRGALLADYRGLAKLADQAGQELTIAANQYGAEGLTEKIMERALVRGKVFDVLGGGCRSGARRGRRWLRGVSACFRRLDVWGLACRARR